MSFAWRASLFFTLLALPLFANATTIALPYCALSTPPGSISPGNTARLIWYTSNATRASIAGIGNVSIDPGYVDVYPRQNTTYTMTVSNSVGSRTCGALVTVLQPQPTYYQYPVYTLPSTNNWLYTTMPVTRNYSTYNTTYYDWYSDYPSYRYSDYNSDYFSDPYVYVSPLGSYSLSAPGIKADGVDNGSASTGGGGWSVDTQGGGSWSADTSAGGSWSSDTQGKASYDDIPVSPQRPEGGAVSPIGGEWLDPVYRSDTSPTFEGVPQSAVIPAAYYTNNDASGPGSYSEPSYWQQASYEQSSYDSQTVDTGTDI